VGFKPGVNDKTYRYYIDFAAAHGIEYVTLDEGWGKLGPGRNLLTPIPSLDLESLASYALAKGVRLILWAPFERLAAEAETACARYSAMGIAGFKVDNMFRYDQQGMDRLHRLCEVAADYKLILDLNGCFPGMGICRHWPNIINVEGVAGMEHCKWNLRKDDFVSHDVFVAFLRQMAGACDYTPGAMRNLSRAEYCSDFSNPASQGTRAHQVALFGVLDSPLTTLCDSPTSYEADLRCLDFISSLPRSFKSKKVLEGRLGEYIVVARETLSGGEWCISGICNWTGRDLDLPLDFLSSGQWCGPLYADSGPGDSDGYILDTVSVSSGDKFHIRMAPGGGFYLRLRKK